MLPVKQEAKQEAKQELEPAKESREQDCPKVLIEYVYPSRWTAGKIIITVVAVIEVAGMALLTYLIKDKACNLELGENTEDKAFMCTLYGITFLTGLAAILLW